MRVVVNEDDRMPAVLRNAIGAVVAVIVIGGILGAALWLTSYSKPKEQRFPNLIGMQVAEAQKAAEAIGVHLSQRDEYNDRYEPGAVYRVDYDAGRPIKAGRTVPVWVSRGSRTVWVPDLAGVPAAEAEAKLKESGLRLGGVSRRTSRRVDPGCVISQEPASGRRVDRDTEVAIVVAEGDAEPGTGDGAATADGRAGDLESRSYTIRFRVPADGAGARRVRVEYSDLNGSHDALDETHDENERIRKTVDVVGDELTLNIYFGDDVDPVHTETIQLRPQR